MQSMPPRAIQSLLSPYIMSMCWQDAERALAMKGMQVIDRNIEVEGIRVASAASGKSDQPYGGLQLHQMAQV